jgi:hypothetical protein
MRATRALIGAAVVLTLATGVVSLAAPAPSAERGFVVHEWGTFSSFSGSDGTLLKFNPANTDLPQFVHHGVVLTKGALQGTVSLETPVTYFYSDKPLTAEVRAEFPAGLFSDWFPRTTSFAPTKSLTWTGVRIRPGDESPLPTSPSENHYYAARATDAAPIEVSATIEDKEVVEREKFLFYRGVGDPKLPLSVTASGGGTFTVRATGEGPLLAAIVMEAQAGRVRFRSIEPLLPTSPTTVKLPTGWSDAESVRGTLIRLLVASGLYEKEARAMVKTWESAWLKDEGTRVLYVLPPAWINKSLPLTVTPKPDVLVRVMVGRHDLLTPERERELDAVLGKQPPDKDATTAALAKLGRFAAAAREQSQRRLLRR